MNRVHRLLCRSSLWRCAVERRILPWVLDGVSLGDCLLEVGPGPGLTTDVLRTCVAHMTALEVDPRLAGALARRLAGSNVRVAKGDAADMPFDADSFSAVVALTMLHHVPSAALQDRVFENTLRVLRPGGWFAGADSTWSIAFHLLHVGDTMVPVDPSTLATRLERVGFDEVSVDRVPGRFRCRARKPAC